MWFYANYIPLIKIGQTCSPVYTWSGPGTITPNPGQTPSVSAAGTYTLTVGVGGCNLPTDNVLVTNGALNTGYITWTGNVDTRWQVAGNWDCGGVPTATDLVIIPAAPIVINKPVINSGIFGHVYDIDIRGNTIDLTEIVTGGELEIHKQ